MLRPKHNTLARRGRLLSLLLLACTPLLAGCDAVTAGATMFGSFLWTDIALTPVRSAIGTWALGIINGV
jgi:hypothetical protein